MIPFECFSHHNLEQQNRAALMNRVDTKFVLPSQRLSEFEQLKWEYSLLKIKDKTHFAYDSVYFDTENQRLFRDHHNGKLNRFKVRLRSYLETDSQYLEIKLKSNKGRTLKKRDAIDKPYVQNLCDFNKQVSTFIAQEAGEIMTVQPQLKSQYFRYTLLHRNKPIRVTIDTNLRFYSLTNGQANELVDVCIVEVKTEKLGRETMVHKLMKKLGVKPCGFSKYCMGLMITQSAVKRNHFKPLYSSLLKVGDIRFIDTQPLALPESEACGGGARGIVC